MKSYMDSMVRERWIFPGLRITLAIIFIWFGALKVLGYNPVYDLIYNSMMPSLASGTGLIVLGLAEAFVGLLLLSNRFLRITHLILFLHLLGTFSTVIYGWDVIFDPSFPILTLEGEFVAKNIILVMSGLAVLSYESNKR